MRISDWSSDVCSSDLLLLEAVVLLGVLLEQHDEGQHAQALHHLDAPVDDLLGEVVLDRRLDATFKQVSAGGARRQAVDHRVVREQAEATNADRKSTRLNSSH